jgi:ribonuclease P protein component
MKKLYRVKKNREFTRIMNQKRYVSCAPFSVYYTPRVESISRIGISVGKKLGGAVVRNKVKRQVRMMVSHITGFDERFDCIILVRMAYLKQAFADNERDLTKSFNTIRLKSSALSIKEPNETTVQ